VANCVLSVLNKENDDDDDDAYIEEKVAKIVYLCPPSPIMHSLDDFRGRFHSQKQGE